MASKKVKIISIVSGSVAVAGLTTGLVLALTLKKPSPVESKDFTITFDAGDGKFTESKNSKVEVWAGTHFDEVDKPVVEKQGLVFTGWVDKDTKVPILGKQTINKNMTLLATYANKTSGEYAIVNFVAGESGAILSGNVSIAVNVGYFFFMVNRPSARLEGRIFKNWVYASGAKAGQAISEDEVITGDVVLAPEFVKSISFEWNGKGATKTRGSQHSYVESGTVFDSINQPVFSNGTMIFTGWYKDNECTNPWKSNDTVTEDSIAYAKWETSVSQEYCTAHYMQKPGTSIIPIFAPANSQAILRSAQWSTVFKPVVSTSTGDYAVSSWEYSENGTDNWQTIQPDTTFDLDEVYIAPIMTPKIETVHIFGSTTAMTEKKQQYKAYIVGSSSQSVTWQVYDDNPETTAEPRTSTIARCDSQGILEVDFVHVENKRIWIQATSTIDTTKKSQPFEVEITLPYMNSSDIWYHDNFYWYSATTDDLCNSESTSFTATRFSDSTAIIVDKNDDFTHQIFIGRNIHTITENFMANFKGFNGVIDFDVTRDGSSAITNSRNNVTVIKSSFLANCIKFNKALTLTYITEIGDNFLFNCHAFNNGYVDSSTPHTTLALNNAVTSIGNSFLSGCYHFNESITLPTSLTTIGTEFMFDCLRFNKSFSVPSSVTTIKPNFMYNCVSFTSTLSVYCDPSAFLGSEQEMCAYSQYWYDPEVAEPVPIEAEIYKTGFSFGGSHIAQMQTLFPTIGSDTYHTWRTIK